MSSNIAKAWERFVATIDSIKERQNVVVRRFLDEIARRKEEKIRQKIKKF